MSRETEKLCIWIFGLTIFATCGMLDPLLLALVVISLSLCVVIGLLMWAVLGHRH